MNRSPRWLCARLENAHKLTGHWEDRLTVHRYLHPKDDSTLKMESDASWDHKRGRFFLANTFWVQKQRTLYRARVGWVKGYNHGWDSKTSTMEFMRQNYLRSIRACYFFSTWSCIKHTRS